VPDSEGMKPRVALTTSKGISAAQARQHFQHIAPDRTTDRSASANRTRQHLSTNLQYNMRKPRRQRLLLSSSCYPRIPRAN
jgi:hypothetical protein